MSGRPGCSTKDRTIGISNSATSRGCDKNGKANGAVRGARIIRPQRSSGRTFQRVSVTRAGPDPSPGREPLAGAGQFEVGLDVGNKYRRNFGVPESKGFGRGIGQ